MRAYKVSLWGTTGIYFAESRGKARYIAARCAKDAGYGTVFDALRNIDSCRRAPEFNCIARPLHRGLTITAAAIELVHHKEDSNV